MPNKENYAIKLGELQRTSGEPIPGTEADIRSAALERFAQMCVKLNADEGLSHAGLDALISLAAGALAIPAPKVQGAAPADAYRQIAHLIGTIFMAGDFKAETGAERELEALLIKTGHRYADWTEVDAINERTFVDSVSVSVPAEPTKIEMRADSYMRALEQIAVGDAPNPRLHAETTLMHLGDWDAEAAKAMRTSGESSERAPVSPELTTMVCPDCNGQGLIGGHRGQTPENYEEVTEVCDECHGQGKIIVSATETAPVESIGNNLEFLKLLYSVCGVYSDDGSQAEAFEEAKNELIAHIDSGNTASALIAKGNIDTPEFLGRVISAAAAAMNDDTSGEWDRFIAYITNFFASAPAKEKQG